jgi:phage-related protein
MVTEWFEFDGITSLSKNLAIVNMDNGLKALPYLPSQSIIEDHPSNVKTPYFYKTKMNPLTFSLSFTLIGEDWTISKKMEIAQWLYKSEYKEFKSDDYPDNIFYIIATNKADFMTSNLEDGYFTVEFRMNSPFAYTDTGEIVYDLTTNPTTTDIVVNCLANVSEYHYPIIQVALKTTSTGFSISNITDASRLFTFAGLDLLETVYVDNDKKFINSSTSNVRYNEFTSKNWLRLKYGNNTLRVTGSCIITLNIQYPVFV